MRKRERLVKKHDVDLAGEPKIVDQLGRPLPNRPFCCSGFCCLDLMLKVDAEMRRVQGVTLAEAAMDFCRIDQLFLSTLGSEIRQLKTQTGAGIVATSFAGIMPSSGAPIRIRSGANTRQEVMSLIEELDLLGHAPQIAEEAVALHRCEQCPAGERDIILGGSQVGLQIHESIGHPIELDRVLGTEANFAGMSFLTLDKLGSLKYGSDIVNVVADATPAHGPGLGTFAYDDEGVPAQCTPIIRDGLFVGYLTSRETAAAIGQSAPAVPCGRKAGTGFR